MKRVMVEYVNNNMRLHFHPKLNKNDINPSIYIEI